DPVGNYHRLRQKLSQNTYVLVPAGNREEVFTIPSRRDDDGRITHGNVADLAVVQGRISLDDLAGATVTTPPSDVFVDLTGMTRKEGVASPIKQVLHDGDRVELLSGPEQRAKRSQLEPEHILATVGGGRTYLQLLHANAPKLAKMRE